MAGLLQASRPGYAASPHGDPGANTLLAEGLFEQATALLAQGRYAESEGYFRQVLRLLPDHGSTHNNLGNSHLAAGAAAVRRRVLSPRLWLTIPKTMRS